MASSEDFKKYIQAGQLTEALTLAMSSAVQLQITTRVLEDEDMATGKESQPGDRLRTNINMVEGQITNEIGEQFTGKNPYKDLKQVHLAQVKNGAKTIQNNLKSLQKLFRLLVAMRQQNLLEVTPLAKLSPDTTPDILLPPLGDYKAIATQPEPTPASAQYLAEPLPSYESPQYTYTSTTPEETTTAEDLEAADPEPKANSALGYGLLATGGTAAVAAVAGTVAGGIASAEDKGGRSLQHESLADMEFDEEEEFEDFSDEDRTVIQPATMAYSPSAVYTLVKPIISDSAPSNPPDAAISKDLTHEEWEDFGENLLVQEVKPMPRDVLEVMTATLEATQPETLTTNLPDLNSDTATPVSTLSHDEISSLDFAGVDDQEEDWSDLELSPLSAAELSSFADTQEAAWEDDWEEETDEVEFPRQKPPAPPGIMGYNLNPDLGIDTLAQTTEEQEWDEVEDEFNFTSTPTGENSTYPKDLDDHEFEIIGDRADNASSLHNAFGLGADTMEDIFGDLDHTLLPEYDSRLPKVDDFADFDSL